MKIQAETEPQHCDSYFLAMTVSNEKACPSNSMSGTGLVVVCQYGSEITKRNLLVILQAALVSEPGGIEKAG